MQYKELTEQQSRLAIDVGQVYEAHTESMRQLAEMKGTLVWKVLRGKTYLFKKLDARGNGRVIGLRSPETEATLQAARSRKAELKERLYFAYSTERGCRDATSSSWAPTRSAPTKSPAA